MSHGPKATVFFSFSLFFFFSFFSLHRTSRRCQLTPFRGRGERGRKCYKKYRIRARKAINWLSRCANDRNRVHTYLMSGRGTQLHVRTGLDLLLVPGVALSPRQSIDDAANRSVWCWRGTLGSPGLVFRPKKSSNFILLLVDWPKEESRHFSNKSTLRITMIWKRLNPKLIAKSI